MSGLLLKADFSSLMATSALGQKRTQAIGGSMGVPARWPKEIAAAPAEAIVFASREEAMAEFSLPETSYALSGDVNVA